jgi:hypothetical protein
VATGGRGVQPQAIECEPTIWFLLHDLEEQGVSFYSLSAKKTVLGIWRCCTTLPELLRPQGVALKLRLDPLKLLLGSIALDGSELSSHDTFPRALGFWACRIKFNEHDLLFIGLLALDRSWEKILAILSLTELDSALVGEKSWRGESRSVMSSLRTLFRTCSDQCHWASARPLGRELGRAQEKLKGGWAGLAPGWAVARIILFLFNSFYNLQTNLNSIQILATSTCTIKYKNISQHKWKYASSWNATIKYLFKYITL